MTADLVVVTGTSSGLGAATSQRLLGAGYRVLGVSRRGVDGDAFGEDGVRYSHITADLAEVDRIPDLVHGVVEEHGVPYGLVNNAAVGTDGLLPTMHNKDILSVLTVDLVSPIILTKYVSRRMAASSRGRVVNISSIVARTGFRGLSAYAAAKAGLEGFTRSLARDLGSRQVTVNCVAPGFVETEMSSTMGDENMARVRRRSPLGRFPSPDEVSAAVEYLLSPAAAGVTGTVLTVDAGATA